MKEKLTTFVVLFLILFNLCYTTKLLSENNTFLASQVKFKALDKFSLSSFNQYKNLNKFKVKVNPIIGYDSYTYSDSYPDLNQNDIELKWSNPNTINSKTNRNQQKLPSLKSKEAFINNMQLNQNSSQMNLAKSTQNAGLDDQSPKFENIRYYENPNQKQKYKISQLKDGLEKNKEKIETSVNRFESHFHEGKKGKEETNLEIDYRKYGIKTNVVIKDDIEKYESNDKSELLKDLAELEKQAYKMILFTEAPKNKDSLIDKNDPFPYYDKFKQKEKQLENLKDKIIKLRKKLGLKEEINFYIILDKDKHNNNSIGKTSLKKDENYPKIEKLLKLKENQQGKIMKLYNEKNKMLDKTAALEIQDNAKQFFIKDLLEDNNSIHLKTKNLPLQNELSFRKELREEKHLKKSSINYLEKKIAHIGSIKTNNNEYLVSKSNKNSFPNSNGKIEQKTLKSINNIELYKNDDNPIEELL